MKKGVSIILLFCLMLSLCACGQEPAVVEDPATVEGPGHDSPEAALLAYAEALKTGDVEQILATFAIETYMSNYDMEEYLDYLKAYNVSTITVVESVDPYTEAINLVKRQYDITRQLSHMYVKLSAVEQYTSTGAFNGEPYDDAQDFLKDLVIDDWMEIIAGMETGDILSAEDLDAGISQEDMETMSDRICDYLNCDDLESLILEVTIDGEVYYLCMDVVCYDGKWYNYTMQSVAAIFLGCDALSAGVIPADE